MRFAENWRNALETMNDETRNKIINYSEKSILSEYLQTKKIETL